MKNFFNKTGIWILAAAVVIVLTLSILSATGTGLLNNIAGTIASPFRSAGAAIGSWFGSISDKFDSVEALCPKVYELEDSYEQAGPLLAALCGEATRRDYDVTACPSTEEPGQLEHLLIPELGVAFVTSKPGMVYPGKPYRRVRLDALSHPENKARLRFRARMTGVLREEGIAALQEAKAAHDLLEGVYNPYVDFEGVRAQAALEAGRLLSWMK